MYTDKSLYIYVLRDTQIVFCSFAQGCVVADVGKAEAHFEKALKRLRLMMLMVNESYIYGLWMDNISNHISIMNHHESYIYG